MKSVSKLIMTSAAVTVCLGAAPAAAEMGRLFFSPPERALLERSRHAVPAEPPPVTAPEPVVPDVVEIEPAAPAPTITVDGYVRRSSGEFTLWLNGENTYDGNIGAAGVDPSSARLSGGRVGITRNGERIPVLLKPGQSYDPNSATTADAYEPVPAGGKITAD